MALRINKNTLLIGTKKVLIAQRKSDKNIKVAYFISGKTAELAFEGTLEEMKTFITDLEKKEDKKEFRKMIAEMNGTSYKTACEDMGISRI